MIFALPRRTLAFGQAPRPERDAVLIGRLQMDRHRIMDIGADTARLERRLQPIAIATAQHILVEHMRRAAVPRRQADPLAPAQRIGHRNALCRTQNLA